MKIGGGGRETFMVLLPMAGLVIAVTVWFGGPDGALTAFEHMAYDAWDWVDLQFRR